jgi:hypothetical protein
MPGGGGEGLYPCPGSRVPHMAGSSLFRWVRVAWAVVGVALLLLVILWVAVLWAQTGA